jgi:hypothetical protein
MVLYISTERYLPSKGISQAQQVWKIKSIDINTNYWIQIQNMVLEMV